MVNQKVIDYARDLANRGFTEDAARSILQTKGFAQDDIEKAIQLASRPPKTNSNLQVFLAIFLLLVAGVIIFALTTIDNNELEESEYGTDNLDSFANTFDKSEEVTFTCGFNDECLFDEYCLNNQCEKLNCLPCEEISNHQCVELSCDDQDSCTLDVCLEGICSNNLIDVCNNGDGCCPSDCNVTSDSDCRSLKECEIDLDCSDDNPQTIDSCIIQNESSKCEHTLINCTNDDLICPSECNSLNDNDCLPICGNQILESPEICDGNCPLNQSFCNDNNTCTNDLLLGSSDLCTAECIHSEILLCNHNDGCCPSGCIYSSDNDCPPNSTLEAQGSFVTVQRTTQGMGELLSYEDGTYKMVFNEVFAILNAELNPDLKVYLAIKPIVTSKEDLNSGNLYIDVLKQISGEQEYVISIPLSLQDYNSIVIFREDLNSIYSYATLNFD